MFFVDQLSISPILIFSTKTTQSPTPSWKKIGPNTTRKEEIFHVYGWSEQNTQDKSWKDGRTSLVGSLPWHNVHIIPCNFEVTL